MSLDITAYRQLTPAPNAELDKDGYPVDYDTFWRFGGQHESLTRDFPGRTNGLTPKTTYSFAASDRMAAGSYSGYNRWRATLARMAGYRSDGDAWSRTEGPFFELIYFSDCEGTIGPVVAEKLARDFAEYEARAETFAAEMTGGSSYWLKKYREWKRMFDMAADGGAVRFH